MSETTPQFHDPRIPILEPGPNLPGVAFREADFSTRGEGVTPFKGGRFSLEPGSTSRVDVHDVRECWMIVHGSGLLTYDGRDFRVETGDFCYFEPRKSHQITNDGDEQLMIYNVWWG